MRLRTGAILATACLRVLPSHQIFLRLELEIRNISMGQEITSGISGSNSSPTWNGHSSLCLPCRSIFSGNRQEKPLGVTAKAHFLQTLQGLQASAESGTCHLCYIRWHDLSRKEREDLQGCTKVTFGFWRSGVGDGIVFEYFYPHLPENGKACLTKTILLKSVDGDLTSIPRVILCHPLISTNVLQRYRVWRTK